MTQDPLEGYFGQMRGMSGLYTHPDTFNYLQRQTRQLITLILEDKGYNIFNLRDRLTMDTIPDFARHCGVPAILKEKLNIDTTSTNEGRVEIAGGFT